MLRQTLTLFFFLFATATAMAQPLPMTTKQMLDKGYAARAMGQFDEALRLFRMGVQQGDPAAEDALGEMYLDGNGVQEDLAMALVLFRQAAAKDYPGTQTSLGIMYSNGWGVAQDQAEALQWYLRAAKHGDVVAAEAVGMIYVNGLGVPVDFEKARPWFHQAIAGGNTMAIPILCDPSRTTFFLAQSHSDVAAMDRVISQTDPFCSELIVEMKARRDAVAHGQRSTNP